jgi:hypothetical protein
MTGYGLARLSLPVLQQWLKLPKGVTVAGIWQTGEDKDEACVTILLSGEPLPDLDEGEPKNVRLTYQYNEQQARDYELVEITDGRLIYYPPWPPISDPEPTP